MDWTKREAAAPTELLHALLVRLVQEEVALFHGTMDLKAQAQTGIVHQVRVDVMDQSLRRKRLIRNQIRTR